MVCVRVVVCVCVVVCVLPVRVRSSLLLSSALHHGLVLAHTESPPLHDAGAFGAGLVLVVRVPLQVLPAQTGLLLIVRLLLLVGHGLPPGAWRGEGRGGRGVGGEG